LGKVIKMTTKPGKIDISAMKKFVNKKVGIDIAHDLRQDNPTEVKLGSLRDLGGLTLLLVEESMVVFPLGRSLRLLGCPQPVNLLWPFR
jgi:hypothetical protein